MASIQEQFAAAAKAHLQAQLDLLNKLTSKTFEGVEKVIELNVDTAKKSLEESSSTMKKMGASSNPQEFFSAAAAQGQPSAERAREYTRQLTEIAADMQSEFARAAEAQVAESRQKLMGLVDEALKNAPPGTESSIAMMKSILANADASYEQLIRNARQSFEMLQTNMKTATDQMGQAMDKASKAGKK
jgi:phasin family protein